MLNFPSRSKLLQSSWPPSNSLAERVRPSWGAAERRVATETAYSNRDGVHASSAEVAGSANNASYHASQLVATSPTAATSAGATLSAGSKTIAVEPLVRNAVASRRASGARPAVV